MPIIIDGWNLIRDDSSDIQDDQNNAIESARILIKYLEHFQESHNDPITLIFDSKNEYLGIDRMNTEKLSVIATSNADDRIKRMIDLIPEKQRRNTRVVSSDNDVFYYAKSSYATPVRCKDFWRKLNGGDRTKPHKKGRNHV